MIGPVFDALTTASARVSSRAESCVRNNPVVAVRSDCNACEAVCPVDAVRFDPLQIVTPPCNGCNLCLPACPTAALTERPAARRDLIRAWKSSAPGKPFTIACALAELADATPGLEVACLASVRWEILLVPLLLGAPRVELRHSRCTGCRLGEHMGDAFHETAGFARNLSQALGLGEIDTSIGADRIPGTEPASRDSGPNGSRRLSRREVFTRIFRGGQDTAEALGQALASELLARLDGKVPRKIVDDGMWARRLVVALMERRTRATSFIPVGPLTGRPEIDRKLCNRCGICAVACPTGALSAQRNDGGENALLLASALCTGCRLCEESCREDALHMAGGLDLDEWTSPPVEVAPSLVATCRRCGAGAIDAALELCIACYRNGFTFEKRDAAAENTAAGETGSPRN